MGYTPNGRVASYAMCIRVQPEVYQPAFHIAAQESPTLCCHVHGFIAARMPQKMALDLPNANSLQEEAKFKADARQWARFPKG